VLDFTQQGAFSAHAGVRLGSGTSTRVEATVSASDPVAIASLAHTSLAIAHLPGESIADLATTALAIGNPDAALSSAVAALQAAQLAWAAPDRESAIRHLLDAAEACGQSANVQADALRTRIDWVVWASTH
jgi:predicted lipid-binding transport protein (Tim44 family)